MVTVSLFYHVTTQSNIRSIRRDGFLDPLKARSGKKVVWFVTYAHVDWAIGHVLTRHALSVFDIYIVRIYASAPMERGGKHGYQLYSERPCAVNGDWCLRDWLYYCRKEPVTATLVNVGTDDLVWDYSHLG